MSTAENIGFVVGKVHSDRMVVQFVGIDGVVTKEIIVPKCVPQNQTAPL